MKNNASALHRLIAGLIDFLILVSLYLQPVFWLLSTENLTGLLNRFLVLIFYFFILIPLFYVFIISLLITKFGGTLGKLFTGTKIVTSEGKKLSFKRAFFRNYIGYIVSGIFFWLGFFWIIIDKERRGWHDQIADTYVIIKKSWGLVMGIIVLIVLLGVNFNLCTKSYGQFIAHKQLYYKFFTDILNESQESSSSETVKPEISSLWENDGSLIGVWHECNMVPAAWCGRYFFYSSGKYQFIGNLNSCDTNKKDEAGFWVLSNDHTKLELEVKRESVWEERGSQSKDYLNCREGSFVKKNVFEPPKSVELTVDPKYKIREEVSHYPSILIEGKTYWKVADDPVEFGQENDYPEPSDF
ncbi:MAG TPA: RDD family protein [Candidatus Bathyarchaeia archaeon]|nr:RDD family protein [Candidatus Bathyarchaeia archaeon]